jgi:hypothetical protein
MEVQHCVRCGRGLKAPQGITVTGDKAIAIYISAVTVGVRPRLISKARRSVCCMPCAVSIAMGPAPESGAFNATVYEILNDLNSRDTTIMEAAQEQKYNPRAILKLMPGSRPDETLATPILKGPLLSPAV